MNEDSLTKKILQGVLIIGAICIAASSPYFSFYLAKNLKQILRKRKLLQKRYKDPKFNNAFYYLRKRGYLDIKTHRGQIYISLTKEGKKRAGKYLIDDLEIKKPKFWDKKWRIVIFDIPNLTKAKREALRGKLKELGFFKLQQSVWVCPYDCQKELGLLRDFFGLNQKELKLITGKIEQDNFIKRIFKL